MNICSSALSVTSSSSRTSNCRLLRQGKEVRGAPGIDLFKNFLSFHLPFRVRNVVSFSFRVYFRARRPLYPPLPRLTPS